MIPYIFETNKLTNTRSFKGTIPDDIDDSQLMFDKTLFEFTISEIEVWLVSKEK